jgi:hypothetical protein
MRLDINFRNTFTAGALAILIGAAAGVQAAPNVKKPATKASGANKKGQKPSNKPALITLPADPSPRLIKLSQSLPAVGQITDFKSLGLTTSTSDKLPGLPNQQSTFYNFQFPKDLDRKSTDQGPLAGKYPGIHLNVPLEVQKSYINYLFISDQPERIKDDRRRTLADKPTEPGATGIYARSPIPKRSTSRILVDHTNGTSRPLHFYLVWISEEDGYVSVKKRSQSVHKDSVAAGSKSFGAAAQMSPEPRLDAPNGTGVILAEAALKPEDTVVLQMEMFSASKGHLAAVVVEDKAPAPLSLEVLEQTPVLHSIVWSEEEDRLGKFIDPKADPTRFNRIKDTFQHARGHFQFPDRLASVKYQVPSFLESEYPVQLYSLFESIPGVDVTVSRGSKPAKTDNRGKYGARVGLKIELDQLPVNCKQVALVALNRGEVFGGRHWVSDGKRKAFETYLRPGVAPGVLRKGQACNLWQGEVSKGDVLTMWTEPMANTSVQLLYIVVPIPDPSAK